MSNKEKFAFVIRFPANDPVSSLDMDNASEVLEKGFRAFKDKELHFTAVYSDLFEEHVLVATTEPVSYQEAKDLFEDHVADGSGDTIDEPDDEVDDDSVWPNYKVLR